MKLPAILTADLHLTANPRDEYRWAFFEWLEKEVAANYVESVVIMGDLTDAKDYHPSVLVNRVVAAIRSLSYECKVYILRGNHDYLKDGDVFFNFLNELPNVEFICQKDSRAAARLGRDIPVLFYPYTKNFDLTAVDLAAHAFAFLHATVGGAVASNGVAMESKVPSKFPNKGNCKIYSGDIHVPQIVGDVEYVGSPYHVHFGDKFEPRVILLDSGEQASNLYFETIRRVTVRIKAPQDLREHNLRKKDQVKVKVTLPDRDKHRWAQIKREVAEVVADMKVELCEVKLDAGKIRKQLTSGAKITSKQSASGSIESHVIAKDLGGDALEMALELIA